MAVASLRWTCPQPGAQAAALPPWTSPASRPAFRHVTVRPRRATRAKLTVSITVPARVIPAAVALRRRLPMATMAMATRACSKAAAALSEKPRASARSPAMM